MTASVEDLVRAQGKLVMFIASLLQRADLVPMAEFAHLLDAFAQTIAETEPGEGEILRAWAADLPADDEQ